jgi:hypothetical protein
MIMDRLFKLPLVVFALLTVIAASSGCRDAPLAENVNSNMAPVAFAGDMQVLEYTGSPVTVTLDGSGSTDPDGDVVDYRWFNGNAPPDGGMGRVEPDPDDVEKPTVTLEAGVWTFTLFVYDNDGGISQPSAVTIMVGSVVAPEVTECVDGALQTIAEECRTCVCGLSDMCRTAIAACDQPCWDFYTCVQNQCGEFVGTDEAGLMTCVRANCSAFFGGAIAYMALDPCVNGEACSAGCAASVAM